VRGLEYEQEDHAKKKKRFLLASGELFRCVASAIGGGGNEDRDKSDLGEKKSEINLDGFHEIQETQWVAWLLQNQRRGTSRGEGKVVLNPRKVL